MKTTYPIQKIAFVKGTKIHTVDTPITVVKSSNGLRRWVNNHQRTKVIIEIRRCYDFEYFSRYFYYIDGIAKAKTINGEINTRIVLERGFLEDVLQEITQWRKLHDLPIYLLIRNFDQSIYEYIGRNNKENDHLTIEWMTERFDFYLQKGK